MPVYRYDNSSLIDEVTVIKNATGGRRAYLHAREGATAEELGEATKALIEAGLKVVPTEYEGKAALEVRGFGKEEILTNMLARNQLTNGTAQKSKTADDKFSFKSWFGKNSFFVSALVYLVGDVNYIRYESQLEKESDEKEKIQNADPSRAMIKTLRTRMMADCFATMMLESTGMKGALQNIPKQMCKKTLSTAKNYRAHLHPLPMALDGLNVIYKDLKDSRTPKTGTFEHTHFMACEIGDTYDDIPLKEWVRFCLNAQDMAWAGHQPSEIISAAVYGSDSPYIRSNAHICAETLNITPSPLKTHAMYNPFADDDANERAHIRLCNAAFLTLMDKVSVSENPHLFLDEARTQTKKLMECQPLGWCAPALIEAENAYRLFIETPNAEEDMIKHAFEAGLSRIHWKDLGALTRRIIALKNKMERVCATDVLEDIEGIEKFEPYQGAFDLLSNKAEPQKESAAE